MERAKYTHTRAREISRRRDAKGASPRNFARPRVCISPAPQSPFPKLETTRSLLVSCPWRHYNLNNYADNPHVICLNFICLFFIVLKKSEMRRKVCLKRPPKSVKFQEKDKIPLNHVVHSAPQISGGLSLIVQSNIFINNTYCIILQSASSLLTSQIYFLSRELMASGSRQKFLFIRLFIKSPENSKIQA